MFRRPNIQFVLTVDHYVGIPENNIPVLDPMLIDSLSLTQGGTVRTTFSNMQVKGLSKLITNSVT